MATPSDECAGQTSSHPHLHLSLSGSGLLSLDPCLLLLLFCFSFIGCYCLFCFVCLFCLWTYLFSGPGWAISFLFFNFFFLVSLPYKCDICVEPQCVICRMFSWHTLPSCLVTSICMPITMYSAGTQGWLPPMDSTAWLHEGEGCSTAWHLAYIMIDGRSAHITGGQSTWWAVSPYDARPAAHVQSQPKL